MEKLKWSEIKTFLSQRNAQLQFIEFNKYYKVIAIDQPLIFYCEIGKVDPVQSGSDQDDFETNYKDSANNPLKDRDETGREIIRNAATVKGWHYQAHSVEFEVCKIGYVYNKDDEGNDLGFSDCKVYKSDGTECISQIEADLSGVKTVVTWKPDFDFEIISGNIRQATKETGNTYIYVNAKIPTGYPAPYDWLKVPFTQGGINMKYIGADETLKTDGRASKLIKASSGSYFEIIANHSPGNHHEMSILFEIYKDPTS